jgi:hypothetical protein
MKININDECGSRCIAVLKNDFSSAEENRDYIRWEGKFHKNGKWSFSEGGIALKEGIVILLKKSTHYISNNIIEVWFYADNKTSLESSIDLGKFYDWTEFPQVEQAILDAIIRFYRERNHIKCEEHIKNIKNIQKFV